MNFRNGGTSQVAGKGPRVISIITPCYNAEKYIEETIRSVLDNTTVGLSSFQLQYIICDGGSTDRTVFIAQETYKSFNKENVDFQIISEPDSGMYEALAKGLRLAKGDVCSYINAGDTYSPHAFEIVQEIFSRNDIKWLTGLQVLYNEKSHITDCLLPFRYRSQLIQCGFYGKFLPFIQQESTFWRVELNAKVDLQQLAHFRYAGDFFLWKHFSHVCELHIVSAWLGGFKRHQGQLSENSYAYQREIKEIADRPDVFDYLSGILEKLIWYAPVRVRMWIAGALLFSFDHKAQRYSNNSPYNGEK